MLKLFHTEDPALQKLPAQAIPIVIKLLKPPGPESTSVQGFVVFIEQEDELSALNEVLCRNLNRSLEGVFHADDYIVGVVIWGNNGDGVSMVCPNVDGYAEEILRVLKHHLPKEEVL